MTNPNLTWLLMISDRSGSMHSCQAEAQKGINAFIDEHKKAEGYANLTFVEFDVQHDTVHDGKLSDFDHYTLVPRYGTALLDAIGFAVTNLGQRLSQMSEEQRPGSVIVLISTDGAENSSREWQAHKVRELLKQQQDKYQWNVIFIGANIDAVKTGASIGIPMASAMQYDVRNSVGTYAMAASNSVAYRGARAQGVSHESAVLDSAFTSDQRAEAMADEDTTKKKGWKSEQEKTSTKR